MTHDELIAKMDDIDVAISNGFGSAKVFLGCVKAVRTIIELHKPDGGLCGHCEEGFIMGSLPVVYPCRTIRAIEKELE